MQVLAQAAASTEHINTPRVLVVDDEQHMCDICARTLRRAGYDVVTTSDPDAAINLLSDDVAFDLLLTDIKMPTMSGFDLAHLARERDPAIAIIIMTGFASMENLQQSVQRGVADFLAKPFELDQLRLAVDQALHKRTLLQDNIRLRAFEQLLSHSERLNSTLQRSEIATLLLDVALEQTNSRTGAVLLLDTTTFELAATATEDLMIAPAGQQLAEYAAQTGQASGSHEHVFGMLAEQSLRHALAVPTRAQGAVNGVLLLLSDRPIGRRMAVQESLELLAASAGAALRNATLYHQLNDAYQRLQELDKLKSEFIAIASHELRTPLSIIIGYTTLIRNQPNIERVDYIQRVMQSAQRIKDIIDDMVSLRHLDTGEAELNADTCDIHELATQAAERVRDEVASHNLQLAVRSPGSGFTFTCDSERALLVIGHLLSNAVKFTPDAGSITLETTLHTTIELPTQHVTWIVSARGDADARWAVFEVIDSGIGVAEREHRRIFDRFYQVADSLTRDHGGTGLGLAVVRELVATMGGALWIKSAVGQGSTFGVALPYHQPAANAPVAP